MKKITNLRSAPDSSGYNKVLAHERHMVKARPDSRRLWLFGKPETGNRKPETGSRKPEAGSRRSGSG